VCALAAVVCLAVAGTASATGWTAYVTTDDGVVYAMPVFPFPALSPGTPVSVPADPGNPFEEPGYVAVAPSGVAYVSNQDIGANYVSVISPGSPPRVTKTISFSGTPEGVAVSPDGSKVYVVVDGSSSSSIAVIDVATNTVVTSPVNSAELGLGASGIAISPDGGTAYVVTAAGVTPVDLENGSSADPIPAGTAPQNLAITPDGKYLYVADYFGSNGDGGDIYEIDLALGVEIGPPIHVPQEPLDLAISPSGGEVYVAEVQSNNVVAVIGDADSAHPSAIQTVTLPLTSNPQGIAFAPDGSAAFVLESQEEVGVGQAGLCELYVPSGGGLPQACDQGGDGNGFQIFSAALPLAIAVTPEVDPTASFTASTAAAGSPSSFDASASSSPNGPIVKYAWNFGDGSTETTGSPRTTHTYAVAGSYTVTLTVTDLAGLSTQQLYTGQTASIAGAAHAVMSLTATVPAAPSSAPGAGTGPGATGTTTTTTTPKSVCKPSPTSRTKTKGNQQLTLRVPPPPACLAAVSSLRPTLGARTLAHGAKLRFASAAFFIDRGFKRVKSVGKHRKVTSYVANATAKRLPASPDIPLRGIRPGIHTLRVVVDLRQTVTTRVKRGGRPVKVDKTRTELATLTSRLDLR